MVEVSIAWIPIYFVYYHTSLDKKKQTLRMCISYYIQCNLLLVFETIRVGKMYETRLEGVFGRDIFLTCNSRVGFRIG